MNRRQFILSSTALPLGVGCRECLGHGGSLGPAQPAAPAAPPVTRFEELRRGVGMFIGTGRHDRLSRERRRRDRRRQPVHEHRRDLRRGAEAARAEGHRDADQHAPSRRPHRRQQGVRREQDRRARKLPQVAPGDDRGGQDRRSAGYATATFTDTWPEKFGDETIEARYFGPGHTGGDAVIHFQQANVMHMGDCCSIAPIRTSIARRAPASTTGSRCSKPSRSARRTTRSSSPATPRTTSVRNGRAELMHFRNYLTAVLDHARAGVKAGQSKEEVTKLPALKGFEDNASPNARLTLAFVLGIAYDEVTNAKPNRPTGQQASRQQASQASGRKTHDTTDRHHDTCPRNRLSCRCRAQAPAPPTPILTEKSAGNGPLDRLSFRPIGPATPSGRVDDLAVLESDPTTFYVAMATAGIYKTTNAGTTFTRSSTTKAAARSAPSRSRRPTRTWSGSAPAKATTARARRGATASTSPPTAGARGRTWASRPASRSRGSSSIPSTSTSSTSRRSAICGAPAASAASTRRPTAA